MSDLIDRQQAIDALTEYGNGRAVFISVGEAVIRIEQLPPAQPERIKGHWTVKEGELSFWDVCSVCRKMIIHRAPHYNFCPHCGAKMEVTT